MLDPFKSLKSNFAHEAAITCKGVGNVALVLAPVFAVAAITSDGDPSGLSAGMNAMGAAGSAVGGVVLRGVGNVISSLSSRSL